MHVRLAEAMEKMPSRVPPWGVHVRGGRHLGKHFLHSGRSEECEHIRMLEPVGIAAQREAAGVMEYAVQHRRGECLVVHQLVLLRDLSFVVNIREDRSQVAFLGRRKTTRIPVVPQALQDDGRVRDALPEERVGHALMPSHRRPRCLLAGPAMRQDPESVALDGAGLRPREPCPPAEIGEVHMLQVELASGRPTHVEQGTAFAGFAVHSPPWPGISARTSLGGSSAVARFPQFGMARLIRPCVARIARR